MVPISCVSMYVMASCHVANLCMGKPHCCRGEVEEDELISVRCLVPLELSVRCLVPLELSDHAVSGPHRHSVAAAADTCELLEDDDEEEESRYRSTRSRR